VLLAAIIAPEILLAVTELPVRKFHSGDLGPSTTLVQGWKVVCSSICYEP